MYHGQQLKSVVIGEVGFYLSHICRLIYIILSHYSVNNFIVNKKYFIIILLTLSNSFLVDVPFNVIILRSLFVAALARSFKLSILCSFGCDISLNIHGAYAEVNTTQANSQVLRVHLLSRLILIDLFNKIDNNLKVFVIVSSILKGLFNNMAEINSDIHKNIQI